MTKKFKIKDLEDDPNLPLDKPESESQVIGTLSDKISLDKLSDDEAPIVPKNTPAESALIKEKVKEKAKVAVEKLVFFERSLPVSYFSKGISTFVVLACLEAISHLLKFLDGINVMDRENFHSLFLGGTQNWVICKIAAFLIFIYFIANKDDIVLNKKGIYCINPEITDTVFFTVRKVFLPWEKIIRVKVKMRLFEPYLFFYDEKDEKLGHLEFSIASKDNFFEYVEEHAGSDHPLSKLRKNDFLF
ncbi:MAG: hypothetical protein WC635_01230 [Bacteriovorax sp.]|jgi:hypothetical protein